MRIAMFTNTYLPHVGGVARSVSTFEEELRTRGHEVRIVAPEFPDSDETTSDVLRTPAIQHFNGSDFSVRLPLPGLIADWLDGFEPEVVHSHHPFLLGDAALRYAWERRLPLAFTHHTVYEQYTRYVPLDSEALRRVAIQMAVEYCELCTHVVAPSESIETLLRDRGVSTPISVIPTGIDLEFYSSGDDQGFRDQYGIPADAIVLGHVGRLAGEKNLEFLGRAVSAYLADHPESVFLVVGGGEQAEAFRNTLLAKAQPGQALFVGKKTGRALADAYAAMDLFVFSSQSETQGMVLAEAMASGAPVVALDGPGVRDVVTRENGRLLPGDATEQQFSAAIEQLTQRPGQLRRLANQAQRSIAAFSVKQCTDRLEDLYRQLIDESRDDHHSALDPWERIVARVEIEWKLMAEKAAALSAAVAETDATRVRLE
ncbi:MAG TPA: glycosyltransferase [Lacipirellulaceae bacterium]|nr:glycosyltransferase [Lacipirellulaceae bacterium]HMP04799.1 glycosyltransferase [Lacipirellulaceae bacterium]